MSEMLGNQYFIARNYAAAEFELEKSFTKQPDSKPLKRKLIICFTQTGKINRSLDMLTTLIQEDIDFLIDADVIHDDCPCPELVKKFENKKSETDYELEDKIMLAILWLYCDTGKSLKYFESVESQIPGNDQIQICLRVIQEYIKTQKSKKEISL